MNGHEPIVTKVVEVPEICSLPWARIVLRNGMILSVNDEGINVWANEEAEREGVTCEGLCFGRGGALAVIPADLNSLAMSQAQAQAVMGELVVKSELGDVAELLELIVAGAHYHPVIGTMLHFLRLWAGHPRGAEAALREARRMAQQINREDTKGTKEERR